MRGSPSRRSLALLGALAPLLGCAPPESWQPRFPEPDAWSTTGPGASTTAFDEAELFEPCGYLAGGPQDQDHHNLSVIHDGLLLHPWAPEWGGGGITLYDLSEPCAPTKVGEAFSPLMRESHSLGLAHLDGRDLVSVDYHEDTGDPENPLGGVGIWDISDPTAPLWLSQLALPGYMYPDSYLQLTLHTFWQGPYIYVSGAFNGLFIVDASDPSAPFLAAQYHFEPNLLVGAFHVVGDRGMASFAGGSRTVVVDLSDPLAPQPLPRGDFETEDVDGTARTYYFSNLWGQYAVFARNSEGGGPLVYDVWREAGPRWAGELLEPDGDGGYVFGHEDMLFVGNSEFGNLYDASDLSAITMVAQVDIPGDLDTVSPIGNLAVVSVDDDAVPHQASALVPWQAAPDRRPPTLGFHRPLADATAVPATVRVGLSFDEMIEPRSVHPGSVRLWSPTTQEVADCWFNVQENVVNVTPKAPLSPDATWVVELPAGGVADASGNALDADLRFAFATGDAVELP
jgi:hypothetical protein